MRIATGSAVLVAAAAVLSAVAPAAHAVLPPPALSFVPDRGGAGVGAPCGHSVRCVGPSGAFATIGEAVAAARSGDTIQVQAGTYRELVVVRGKTLTLRGGFAAGFARRSPVAEETVIDAAGEGSAVTLSGAGNSSVDGFTITRGRATLNEDRGGGGSGIKVEESGRVSITRNLIVANDDGTDVRTCDCSVLGGGIGAAGDPRRSSLVVRGNVIRGNRAHRGGGMAIGLPAVIEGNLVESNAGGSDHGGGLYLNAPRMTVRRNLIRGNSVGDQAGYGWGGGGIFYGGAGPSPRASFGGNRWVGNSAPSAGSALFVDDSAVATITGDLFHGNACPETGGAGLYVDGGGDPARGSVATLENVTITGHRCGLQARGSAIFTEGGSRIAVTNSIITGNGSRSQIYVCAECGELPLIGPSTIAYSLVGPGAVNVRRGAGMRSGSAGFLRPAGGDFHLGRLSRGIDAAAPSSSVGLEPRPHGGRRDIGAYGGTREAARRR
ncbi:hypothetical protein DSM112329_05330 [Paraconexibacter sp. AEG42_29]|uniref:Right handed beta helix domain-containing protein n=1 Tax=Paraconexibacter sp. AEG42_29 TaxID=2997339 RepID=A0AAU7B398_9ACTN